MSRTFSTAKEREAYHARTKDVNWLHLINMVKARRSGHKQAREAQSEQERINRILDASPSYTPLTYRKGEVRDEPYGYVKPDSRKIRPVSRGHGQPKFDSL